jgi:hypothetical protein
MGAPYRCNGVLKMLSINTFKTILLNGTLQGLPDPTQFDLVNAGDDLSIYAYGHTGQTENFIGLRLETIARQVKGAYPNLKSVSLVGRCPMTLALSRY